ncbi:hypothetical protein KX522_26450, partial [Escherichia coli]|nr:hypothetical protein [Escherichia coli]
MPIQVPFRFLAHSRAWRLGRWGCGERCHLSHIVDDPDLISGDRVAGHLLNALRTSQAHKTGSKCPSG